MPKNKNKVGSADEFSSSLREYLMIDLTLGVNNGQIECKTTTQTGMRSVNYYITSDASAIEAKAASAWDIISYNTTKFTFSDLTPGQRYYIKVGLVGVRDRK